MSLLNSFGNGNINDTDKVLSCKQNTQINETVSELYRLYRKLEWNNSFRDYKDRPHIAQKLNTLTLNDTIIDDFLSIIQCDLDPELEYFAANRRRRFIGAFVSELYTRAQACGHNNLTLNWRGVEYIFPGCRIASQQTEPLEITFIDSEFMGVNGGSAYNVHFHIYGNESVGGTWLGLQSRDCSYFVHADGDYFISTSHNCKFHFSTKKQAQNALTRFIDDQWISHQSTNVQVFYKDGDAYIKLFNYL